MSRFQPASPDDRPMKSVPVPSIVRVDEAAIDRAYGCCRILPLTAHRQMAGGGLRCNRTQRPLGAYQDSNPRKTAPWPSTTRTAPRAPSKRSFHAQTHDLDAADHRSGVRRDLRVQVRQRHDDEQVFRHHAAAAGHGQHGRCARREVGRFPAGGRHPGRSERHPGHYRITGCGQRDQVRVRPAGACRRCAGAAQRLDRTGHAEVAGSHCASERNHRRTLPRAGHQATGLAR